MSRILPFAAAAAVCAAGCSLVDPGAGSRVLEVHHHPVECMGPWEQLCLLVRPPGEQDFLRHYGGIEGFTHEWGREYVLEVVDRPVPNPPADGSSVRTILTRVVAAERVPAGTAFDIILTGGPTGLTAAGDDRFTVYGDAEFVCPPGTGCALLAERVAAGARLRLTLEHPADAADPLVLRQWTACTAGSPGSSAC